MAACYVDEEELWKCQKHPSKRHRSGVCPACLRGRLSSLCPECANVRPCACIALTTSSSSSSSSSFSRFSVSGGESFGGGGVGTVGRVSNLIESEPAFRRSRSVAVPFLRSKSKTVSTEKMEFVGSKKTMSFWGWLKKGGGSYNDKSKTRVGGGVGNGGGDVEEGEDRRVMMTKSRSVAVTTTSDYAKSKGSKWYFPSPISVFRHNRLSKVVTQDRSPMYRG